MITLRELSFGYSKTDVLFEKLNLRLQPGNVCGLLGKNGAGKTTLLKIMAGLLFFQTGDCIRFGFNVKNREPESLSHIYFVPEEFFVPQLTAKQYLDLYAPFYSHFDTTLFEACIKEFDIPNNKLLPTFSYGQKKKLFIISTHRVHDVEKLVDRVVILDDGKIIINSSLAHVTKTIAIEQESSEPSLNSCIYYEKNISGYAVVTENKSNRDSNIDLEIFFNMVIANKEKSSQLFGGE